MAAAVGAAAAGLDVAGEAFLGPALAVEDGGAGVAVERGQAGAVGERHRLAGEKGLGPSAGDGIE